MIVFVFTFTDNVCNVNAHRAVISLKEYAFFKAFKDFVLTLKVGFAFHIKLIKRNSCSGISFLYTFQSPVVHLLPEGANFRIPLFPLNKHIFCHLICFRMSCFRLVFFALKIAVKFNITLAHKVVTLHAKTFWCITLCLVEKLISQHRFTDVNTAVINKVYLVNFCTRCLKNTAYRFTKGIITQMPKVQRLVCIWRRIFNHYPAAFKRLFTVRAERTIFFLLCADCIKNFCRTSCLIKLYVYIRAHGNKFTD